MVGPKAYYYAVRLGWLKQFAKRVPREWSTADVVMKLVKPETQAGIVGVVRVVRMVIRLCVR